MIEISIDASVDYVAQFSNETKLEIPTITKARANALLVHDKLRKALYGEVGDADVVAFGSLARLEWTSGSDIDWTLLVDGIADAEHRASSRRIKP
jgi:DNA polymerase sigma